MDVLANWKVTLLGLASWAVPFIASFAFYGPGGELLVPLPLFKSLMAVISGGVGALLLVRVFRTLSPTFRSGLLVGLYWLALNLVLDIAALVPLTGMSVSSYFADIGLRYTLIPIQAASIGAVAGRASNG